MIQLLVLAIAMLIGLASTRLMKLIHLPNVTGYLIAGILIGPYVLGLAFSSLSFTGEPLKSLIYDISSNIDKWLKINKVKEYKESKYNK